MSIKKFIVELTDEEREICQEVVKELRGNNLPDWYWSISGIGEYCDACRMHT